MLTEIAIISGPWFCTVFGSIWQRLNVFDSFAQLTAHTSINIYAAFLCSHAKMSTIHVWTIQTIVASVQRENPLKCS